MSRLTSFVYPRLLRLRNRHFLLLDALILCLTPALALMLRVDGVQALGKYTSALLLYITAALVIRLLVFYGSGLYSRYWRYASIGELTQIGAAVLVSTLIIVMLFFAVRVPALGVCDAVESACALPRSIPLVDAMLVVLAIGMTRFSVRTADLYLQRSRTGIMTQRILVMGAGEAGTMIAREMQANPQLGLDPIGFLDDDPHKQGMRIRGLPVLGDRTALPNLVEQHEIDQVIIAMPTAPGKAIRQVLAICEQAGVPAKTMPGMYELLGGQVSVNQLRNVEIEDLLRREPVNTDTAAVHDLIAGRAVLVTGGGGSIGSELCRQILRCGPAKLIILGHGENSVFEIHQELLRMTRAQQRGDWEPLRRDGRAGRVNVLSVMDGHPVTGRVDGSAPGRNGHKNGTSEGGGRAGQALQAATGAPKAPAIVPVIADIRFVDRLHAIFQAHGPDIVFHTAAHKHLPLMEENPGEAVTNNVLGTRNVLEAALAAGVERFVLISTDKAVNPSSVMGASKRLAELVVHQAAAASGCPYVAVRFGNVLGSRGSVVLTFKQQIAAGGPVTVTDPAMTRFFMTIPEAVQLVLQAAVLGCGGETFVLDMGEPVKIVDLARDLISLSGLEEGRDIDIVYTGLRPGEKLYEELFVPGEAYERTAHAKIFIATDDELAASRLASEGIDAAIDALIGLAQRGDEGTIKDALLALIPELQDAAVSDKP